MNNVKQTLVTITGCLALLSSVTARGDVEVSPSIKSCHPSYKAATKYDKFGAQQRKPGSSIQYGAYPNISVSGDRYIMTVRAGGKKIDRFNQTYPPHGSVNRSTVSRHRGDVLSAVGDIYRNGKLTLHFELRRRIV